jgi:acyl-coenzyme A synthetase/AMP-(fatty) acid ligase
VTIRDGFGQTETTALIGNTPRSPVKPGSMGRPLPGVAVEIVDPVSGQPASEGEICLRLDPRPVNLMTGYLGDDDRNNRVTAAGYYHTGDVASRDSDGHITYIGRTDDVFKASDYKISPFELESVLIEHPAVAEAAVVGGTQGLYQLGGGVGPRSGHRRRHLRPCAPQPRALPTHPADRIHGATQDDLRQNSACRPAGSRKL